MTTWIRHSLASGSLYKNIFMALKFIHRYVYHVIWTVMVIFLIFPAAKNYSANDYNNNIYFIIGMKSNNEYSFCLRGKRKRGGK